MGNWKSKSDMSINDPKHALRIYGSTLVYESFVTLVRIERVWGIELENRNGEVSFYKTKDNTLPSAFEIGESIIDTLLRES